MKINNVFMITMVSCATLFSLALHNISKIFPETETKYFCAYGKIFVEFKEGDLIWGTIMLDDDGKPISCSKASFEREEPTNYKNRISI